MKFAAGEGKKKREILGGPAEGRSGGGAVQQMAGLAEGRSGGGGRACLSQGAPVEAGKEGPKRQKKRPKTCLILDLFFVVENRFSWDVQGEYTDRGQTHRQKRKKQSGQNPHTQHTPTHTKHTQTHNNHNHNHTPQPQPQPTTNHNHNQQTYNNTHTHNTTTQQHNNTQHHTHNTNWPKTDWPKMSLAQNGQNTKHQFWLKNGLALDWPKSVMTGVSGWGGEGGKGERGVGTISHWENPMMSNCFAGFCGGEDTKGHLFWGCPWLPLTHIREDPQYATLMAHDTSERPRCLLWHGWLPQLTTRIDKSPWAVSTSDSVDACLVTALGGYPIDPGAECGSHCTTEDIADLVDEVPGQP